MISGNLGRMFGRNGWPGWGTGIDLTKTLGRGVLEPGCEPLASGRSSRPGLYFSWRELKGEKKARQALDLPAAVSYPTPYGPAKRTRRWYAILSLLPDGLQLWRQAPGLCVPGKDASTVGAYLYGKYFLCRYCHGLAYESQRQMFPQV